MNTVFLRSVRAGVLGGCGALALAGCQTIDVRNINVMELATGAGKLAQTLSRTVSPEEEEAMGRDATALLLGTAPLVKHNGVQQYVNQVGRWVASQSDAKDVEWRFAVIDSDTVNAFAAPAGYVLITRGLFMRLHDEAELAGVLGHEIAHVVKGHYVKTMLKQDRAGALAGLAGSLAESQGKVEYVPLVNLSRGVYSSGLDKGDEYQADRMGVVFAARAGYDPYGLPRVLQMYSASAGGAGFELLFSTHPSPDDRLDKLADLMDTRFETLEASGQRNEAGFKKQVRALGGRG